ncbi:MAG: response regulator transcription factor [Alphaproteobacteria bacterium]|nr:response regulator transcription factor [Alphaproteobacteria bacterium]
MSTVILEDSDPDSRQAFERIIKSEGMSAGCTVAPGKTPGAVVIRCREESFSLPKPLRVGAVLAQVHSLLTSKKQQEYVQIGEFTLDTVNYELTDKKRVHPPVRLTEKEGKILVLMAAAKGKLVDRQLLLDSVWGYAKGVETHTLETHIYRLRQKIERDPSEPKILLTEINGYRLALL